MCYKTLYGYLGGIHIAIMILFLKTKFTGSAFFMLTKFFSYYSETLGQEVITLKKVIEDSPVLQSPLVILTPAKLMMNSARNVTISTLHHIINQFKYVSNQLQLLMKDNSVS